MENKPREMLANGIASSAAAAVRAGEEDCSGASGQYLRSSGPAQKPATDTAGEPSRGYRSFFENAVEGMYRTTLDGRYLDVNPALARMYGCETPEAFIGHFRNASVHTYVDPASREELVRQMRDQGYVRSLEGEAYRRNGTRFWISVTGHPLWDDEGQLVGYECFVVDITERRRAQDAVRESELHKSAILDSALDPIITIDKQGLILGFNPAAERIFGFRRADVLGKPLADLVVPPQCRDEDQIGLNRYLETGESNLFGKWVETSALRADGTEFPVELAVTPTNISGKPTFTAYLRDITERKQAESNLRLSEERFRQMAESIQEVFWLIEPDEQRIVYVSPSYERLWGRTRESLNEDPKSFLDAIHPDDRERVRSALAKQALGEYQEEYRIVRPDGSVRWIWERAFPIWDSRFRVSQIAGVAVDVTERKRLEQQVRQSVKMKAIGQLTGGMAHDFNNLLAVILANLELLEETELTDDQQRDFIDSCVRSARRGAELTHRLLAFARRQPLAPQVTEVNALLTGMTDLLRRTLGENIAIRTEWDANLGKISIDPGELESAVLNLAINARDAMPDGGNLIIETLNAELDRDYAERNHEVRPGSYVMLAISDTGIGMPPEILDHVFEPFFTTKDVGHGSGLGLSMVYGFVKQSGGHIKVYSEPGIGSTIKIYLPILAGTDQPCSVAELEANKPRGNGEIVLLVEDSADVRKSVARRLKRLGYQVLEAADGPSALTVLREADRIDLLFTDLVLPHGMSGVALALEARKHHPAMQVLYMSGYTENVVGQKGILDDGSTLIGKPFTAIELAHALREALNEVEG